MFSLLNWFVWISCKPRGPMFSKSLVCFLKNTRPGEMPDHSAVRSGVAKAFQATLPVQVSRTSSLINTKFIWSLSSNSHFTFFILLFFRELLNKLFGVLLVTNFFKQLKWSYAKMKWENSIAKTGMSLINTESGKILFTWFILGKEI